MVTLRKHRTARGAAGLVAGLIVLSASVTMGAASVDSAASDLWFLEPGEVAHEFSAGPDVDPAAWGKLRDSSAMVRALVIPATELEQMSTRELLGTVLDYPLLGNYLAYATPQEGVDALRSEVPALEALLLRSDVGPVLLDAYAEVDLEALLTERRYAVMEVEFIELLLAQSVVLENLGLDGRAELAQAAVTQFEVKVFTLDSAVYGQTAGVRVLMRALEIDSAGFAEAVDSNQATQEFLTTGAADPDGTSAVPLVDMVRDTYGVNAVSLVVTGIEGTHGRSVPTALPTAIIAGSVNTPRGTLVSVQVATSEPLTATQITTFNQWMAQNYPNATLLRSATGKYNCHSYAWHSTSTANNVWMNSASSYMTDGSYRRVVSTSYVGTVPTSAPANSKVNYVGGNHSGIRYSSTRIDSKWGQYGLMRHAPNYTPYTGTTSLEYYTAN